MWQAYIFLMQIVAVANKRTNEKVKTKTHFRLKSMLLANKDSCNTQIIQCVNDTIFRQEGQHALTGQRVKSLLGIGLVVWLMIGLVKR